MRTHKALYNIYKAQKKLQTSAGIFFEASEEFSDSLRNTEIRTRILEMELAYETKKKRTTYFIVNC